MSPACRVTQVGAALAPNGVRGLVDRVAVEGEAVLSLDVDVGALVLRAPAVVLQHLQVLIYVFK